MTFDDENGIGTLPYLMEQILKGTGWRLGSCDKMLERDGKTEKIRTLTSEGKEGSYALTTKVCNLFYAYPDFDGENKTVNIYALNNKGPTVEMTMGRDIDSLSVSYNSEDIITRLYVEGEYSDFGYVGIDDINPTGLNYLMNFDYYRSIGLFTEEHEVAQAKYYADMKAAIDAIREVSVDLLEKENELNVLWGQIDYLLYHITDGTIGTPIVSGTVDPEKQEIVAGDKVIVVQGDNVYREEIMTSDAKDHVFSNTDTHVIKFITLPSGQIGAKQVAIEAKEKLIASQQRQLINTSSEDRKKSITEQISSYEKDILEIKHGRDATDELEAMEGLYAMMFRAAQMRVDLDHMYAVRSSMNLAQNDIEAEFAVAMGGLLKDGYWNDPKYTVGQEESLYKDALDMMEVMSKPSVSYMVSLASLANQFKYKPGDLKVNMKSRVYDNDLGVNDIVYISRVVRILDDCSQDTAQISNEDIRLSGQTLDSILSRMTDLSNLIEQKNALFSRAEAITQDGTIYMDRLKGTINVQKTQLASVTSSWYTDANGNLVFESANGRSAMMITGEGFMIADGKADGEWNWRCFGTGEGFSADEIITGYLSAERIESGSITTQHLSSEVGKSLNLSSNESINSTVTKFATDAIDDAFLSIQSNEEPSRDNLKEGDLWMDVSSLPYVLFRWNGEEWIAVGDEDIDRVAQEVKQLTSSVEQTENSITSIIKEYATKDYIQSEIQSAVTQSKSDFTVAFSRVQEGIDTTTSELEKYKREVESYMRYNGDSLELGKSDSKIKAELTNEKLAFTQDNIEVAFVSDHKLYIPEANIVKRIAIGNTENGYFNLTTTPTGLAITWKT